MKHFSITFIAAILLTGSVDAQPWAKARLEQSPRHLEWATLTHGEREVACYVGYPEVKEKATAVVVIHDVWGMSDWARGMASLESVVFE